MTRLHEQSLIIDGVKRTSHPTPAVGPGVLRKVIVAAAIGNFVEWFDFAAYGFLATVLTRVFFPSDTPSIALLKAFAVFAVAFALRPLGGIVFGVIGDRIGRKRTLALTILMMAGATTLIGILPSYASIGLAAPALLTLVRCIQGFSAGGEYAGACAYVMEHAPRTQRGKYGSFIPVSTFLSFAVAATVAYVLSAVLTPAQLDAWGWRIPFLAAAPIGLIGVYLRLSLSETPAFQVVAQEHAIAHSPLKDTLRTQGGKIIALSLFISVTALSFYMFTTYLATYMQVAGGLSRNAALLITVISLVFAGAICPLAGLFTDAVGRRKTMATVCVYLIVAVYPCFALAGSGSFASALLGVLILSIGAVLSGVVTATLLSEVFPTRTRYTASAITYNVAYTIFGGTAPLVATYLIGVTGNKMSPAAYMIAISVMGLIGGLTLKESSKVSLHHTDDEPYANPLAGNAPADLV